jgi:hypothetical protein
VATTKTQVMVKTVLNPVRIGNTPFLRTRRVDLRAVHLA